MRVKHSDRIFAVCIIVFSMSMAVGWTFFLPIFLNPDEDSHYDYALTLFTTRKPMSASENLVGRDTNPVVEYLMRETHARQERIDANVRADPGYGTTSYFSNLAAKAPHFEQPEPGRPVPYISRLYPITYFAMAATAIAIGDALSNHSVVAQFFSARLLSVVLLIPTLWFTWLTLRELGLKNWEARAILTCVATLPLTNWMASSVQPDVLASALIAPATFLALRLRRNCSDWKLLITLALVLAALAGTKQHYFAAMYVPIAAMLLVRLPWKRSPLESIRSTSLLSIPPIITIAISSFFLHTTLPTIGICQGPSGLSLAMHEGPKKVAEFMLLGLQRALRGTFLDEHGMSFWINYTAYRNTSLTIISKSFTQALTSILPALSVMIAILGISRVVAVIKRLVLVGRKRSWLIALKLATANVLFNSYLTFIIIIFGFEASVGGYIPMQGRYWLPFLPAIWLMTFFIAPRALPYRLRIPASRTAIGIILVFGILASIYTFPSIHQRFYGPPTFVNPRDEITSGIWADVSSGTVFINGVAYDNRTASPVQTVDVLIDNRTHAPRSVPFDRPDVQCDMEKSLLHVGFKTHFSIASLSTGPHTVDVYVKTVWSREFIKTTSSTTFFVKEAVKSFPAIPNHIDDSHRG